MIIDGRATQEETGDAVPLRAISCGLPGRSMASAQLLEPGPGGNASVPGQVGALPLEGGRLGRHSAVERDQSDIMPDTSQQLRSASPPWRARRRLLTVLGSIAAVIIVAGTASVAVGRGKTSGRPSGHSAMYSGSAKSGKTHPVTAGSPVAVGPAAIARVPSPSPSPSPPPPSALPSAQVNTSGLPLLPTSTNLTGSEAAAWADAALGALGAPDTTANVQTLMDWFANEGAPHDLNNPLNLNTPYGGSTISTANGDPSYVHVQAYPEPQDFLAAFRIQMNNGPYAAIVAALKAGTGLEGSAATPEIASELSLYSGGGYDSIPAAYCPCS
jgi:hypothetical protein